MPRGLDSRSDDIERVAHCRRLPRADPCRENATCNRSTPIG